MNQTTYKRLVAAADRLWRATYAVDELRGDNVVSNRIAERVRGMIRSGEAESPTAVALLARSVERYMDEEGQAGAA